MTRATTRTHQALAAGAALLLFSSFEGAGVALQRDVPAGRDACVLEIGDFNHDGLGDYAVTQAGQASTFPTVRVVPGRGGEVPVAPDAAIGQRRPAFVVRGPAAAPFSCPDEGMRAALGTRRLHPGLPAVRRPVTPTESPLNGPASYRVVDLDPLMPGYSEGFSSVASGINAHGHVVGRFFTQQGERAYVYDGTAVRDLGTLGGHISEAHGINDRGTVVGRSLTGEADERGFVHMAFLSDGFSLHALGRRWSSAQAINNREQIVGETQVQPDIDLNQAFLHHEGRTTILGSLPPLSDSSHSVALSIDDAGRVVGASSTVVTGTLDPSARHAAVHAFVYENGVMRDLRTLGTFCAPVGGRELCVDRSAATDINGKGRAAGYSTTSGGATHAFLTEGDRLLDLGAMDGTDSWAYGTNDSGQVVGGVRTAEGQMAPFLYHHGRMYDLNALVVDPPGTRPLVAYAINNFGHIAGNHHLLTPVYETIAPGRDLSFDVTPGDRLTFEYWLEPGVAGACRSPGNRRFHVQVSTATTARRGPWLPAADLPGCQSTDWGTASVSMPMEGKHERVRVRIRVVGSDPRAKGLVYVRHVRTE